MLQLRFCCSSVWMSELMGSICAFCARVWVSATRVPSRVTTRSSMATIGALSIAWVFAALGMVIDAFCATSSPDAAKFMMRKTTSTMRKSMNGTSGSDWSTAFLPPPATLSRTNLSGMWCSRTLPGTWTGIVVSSVFQGHSRGVTSRQRRRSATSRGSLRPPPSPSLERRRSNEHRLRGRR